jgi:site-specific DNA-methyltransferase (adenine-specific)
MMESKVFNIDCMVGMAEYPDKYFDLAVVDPPYGIGNFIPQTGKYAANNFDQVKWNDYVPEKTYFNELERISKNQIIWGANYYNCFNNKNGAIVWDKKQMNPRLSRCEIASQSFNKLVTYVEIPWAGFIGAKERSNIHPCEKPVSLYDFVYKKYIPKGGKILDTHIGSGSSRIAADKAGNIDFVGYELDKDYFDAQEKRWTEYKMQQKLF